MAGKSRSSRLFAERSGIRRTYRGPSPSYATRMAPIYDEDVPISMRDPEAYRAREGEPPGDRGASKEWPWDSEEES